MNTMTGFLIGALVVTAGTLAYLYFEETKNDVGVKVDLPNVKIETP